MRRFQLKAFLLFNIFLGSYVLACSQSPEIQWEKSFGGSADEIEKNVQQTTDGGYIVGGWTLSNDGDVSGNHGKIDYWIVKLNSAGDLEWQKCIGGSSNDKGDGDLGGLAIRQTSDAGYIIAANTASVNGDITSNHGGIDYWIVKLNETGAIEWQKTLGGSKTDIARSIQLTADGGYIVAGHTSSNDGDVTGNHGDDDYWIVKLDELGNITWQKCFGGSGTDLAFSIKQTKNGNYIVAGYADSNDGQITDPLGDWDYWIINLDNAGNIIWQKSYGGSGEDYATDIIESDKGGYVITGYTASEDGQVTAAYGEYDSWIIKIKDDGSIEWQKSLGGSGDDASTFVQQTSDGDYIVSQITSSTDIDDSNNSESMDSWIVKLSNVDGSVRWQKFLGGSDEDVATSVQQTKDGGYIVGNYSASNDGDVSSNKGGNDYWIVKLKPVNILPLSFLSFTAQKQQQGTMLKWQTTNEINCSYFDIEKSTNANVFSSIGTALVGKAANVVNNYLFLDSNSNENIVYYRIKQVDKDGKYSYSKVIKVGLDIAKIKFGPNPSPNGNFSISLPGVYKNIGLSITNEAGKMIYNKSFFQTNNINFNIKNNKGIYFAKIRYDNNEQTLKLIIK